MKKGNLYDLDAFKAFSDSTSKGFTDAYAGVNLSRNLTHVNAKIFNKSYPELTFVNSGIQADNTGGYAKRIQSLRLLAQGGFAEASDRSGSTGKISLSAEDTFLAVREFKSETEWSMSDIEESKLTNVNLPSEYLKAVNKTYMREVDKAGFVGLGSQKGLLNHGDIVAGTASGAGATLSAQALYDEIATLITDQWNAVNNTPEYIANAVTMPTSTLNLLSKKMLNTAGGTQSVLKALQDNFGGIKFNASFRSNDVAGSTSTVAYSTSEDAMVMRLPVPLRVGELIKVGSFNFKTDYIYRIGGFDLLEPTSARILTGL